MNHDINEDRLDDCVDIGNFNALFPLLNLAIQKNKALPPATVRRVIWYQKKLQQHLLELTHPKVFGREDR